MAIIRRYLAKFPAKFASHHPDFLNLLQLSEKNEPKPQNKEKRTPYKASFISLIGSAGKTRTYNPSVNSLTVIVKYVFISYPKMRRKLPN